MSGGASANEGKIHLGYMYANDPTFATARMMMLGTLSFEPLLRRHLSCSPDTFRVSRPAIYSVHRDSQVPPDEIAAYLRKVHALVGEMAGTDRGLSNFGRDVTAPLREWTRTESDRAFDPGNVVGAFDTPEVAINPAVLANLMRERIMEEPRVEVRLDQSVKSVSADDRGIRVACLSGGTPVEETFDEVVNCLWDGRIEVDRTFGHVPTRPWLHRLKYGVRLTSAVAPSLPSTTIISGPFGEVVNYGDGLLFLTWYPTCVRGLSPDLSAPAWALEPDDALQVDIATATASALTGIVPGLSRLSADDMAGARVKGGVIVAWGASDIYDQTSELHRRFDTGIGSHGRYHSIDPGKLTLAPYFAEVCGERVSHAA